MFKWLGVFLMMFTSTAFSTEFKIGTARVIPLLSKSSDMDAALFPQASADLIKRAMPSGKAEASRNAFLLQLDGQNILIDSGLQSSASDLIRNLKNAGVTPEQVDFILMTHLHGDHVGGLVSDGKAVFPKARVFVSLPEYGYWTGKRASSDLAKNILGLYAGRVETFLFGDEIIDGIMAVDAVGHTSGHTAFLVETEGGKILFWGDIVHAAALQFSNPDLCATYDMDVVSAVFSRKRLMAMAAKEKIPVAGAHLPPPSIGRVLKEKSGAFSYQSGL